jgi:homocysteine S-methyltransferase
MHDGSEYRGRYGKSREFLADFHRERTSVLVAAQPDLLAIETIPDVDEAYALTDVISGVPAWLSFSCESAERTCAGQPIEDAAELVSEHFDAIGVNCTKPEFISGLITRIRRATPDLPIVVYPNAGRVWDGDASVWLGDGEDLLPRAAVQEWMDLGASLIGGCCGLGPAAIVEVADLTRQELL